MAYSQLFLCEVYIILDISFEWRSCLVWLLGIIIMYRFLFVKERIVYISSHSTKVYLVLDRRKFEISRLMLSKPMELFKIYFGVAREEFDSLFAAPHKCPDYSSTQAAKPMISLALQQASCGLCFVCKQWSWRVIWTCIKLHQVELKLREVVCAI